MPIQPTQFSQLIPLRGLPEPVLDYIRQQAWIEKRAVGNDLYAPGDTHDSAYLLEGQVTLCLESGVTRTLNAGTAAARYPLLAPRPAPSSAAICETEVSLLRVPGELIESVYHSWWNPRQGHSTGIELKEDCLEDEIYMAFFQRIQSGDYELPGMPEIAFRISKAADNPKSNSDDLARIITSDPALATRLIRTANSPAFGGENTISHCRDAVTRLGYSNTRNLVISFGLKHLFSSNSQLIEQRMRQLWRHSRRVAAISHVLARMTPDLVCDQAILTGLIHDVGAIPLLIVAADYPELTANPKKLDQLVLALKGEVGALILRHWGFQQSYIDTALHCNNWFRHTGQAADYIDVVILAQLFSHIGSPKMDQFPAPDLLPAFHKVAAGKLNPRLSLSILAEAEDEIRAVEELLEGN